VRHRPAVADIRAAAITEKNSAGHAVLVTGASTGIGYASVAGFVRAGVTVYAGVRTEEDARRVESLGENVRPVMLDVTNAERVADVAARIGSDGAALVATVCNAGVAFGGPLEFVPLDRMRKQLEVNLIGALAVAQATLPMLRETKGRLIFIGSISGRITPPFIGPYATSKAALATLSDALRFELDASHSGVSVVLFEFGDFRTPIWEKGASTIGRVEQGAPPELRRYYGFAVDALRTSILRSHRGAKPVEEAARAIVKAALDPRPRARYRGGSGATLAVLATLIPTRARGKLIRKAMGLP
jgi:NAD(P)-dependent dehydrogenase (short-subunit alcohol dehydrogenase family)